MRITKLLPIILLLTSCYNNFGQHSDQEHIGESNYTIEALHNALSSKSYCDITDDLTVSGVVTANDESGNLYDSFIIQHNGYAVEILVDLSNLYVKFPEESIVYVNLKGLRIMRSYGVIQLGLPSANMGEIESICGVVIIDNYITVTNQTESVTPYKTTLNELVNSPDLDSYYGRLVELDNMILEPNDYLNPNNYWSGTNSFSQQDPSLDSEEYLSITVYTSIYANYSMTTIPDGECAIVGILESGSGSTLSLTMRRASDCISTSTLYE